MKKKILVLGLVLTIALSALGVGYALWSDTLTINGTVNTGNVDVQWSWSAPYDTEPAGKDVSWMEVYGTDTIEDILYVTLYNAYPCIDYYCAVDVHNVGTVPVILTGLQFNAPPGVLVEMLPNGTGNQIAEGTQIHPGDFGDPDAWALGLLHVHLDNSVAQSSVITFTGEVTAVQYNEYTPPAP